MFYDTLRVSDDNQSWQELECFLFTHWLGFVETKRDAPTVSATGEPERRLTKTMLRGRGLFTKIRRYLESILDSLDWPILKINPSVQELGQIYIQFQTRSKLDQWKRSLVDLSSQAEQLRSSITDHQDPWVIFTPTTTTLLNGSYDGHGTAAYPAQDAENISVAASTGSCTHSSNTHSSLSSYRQAFPVCRQALPARRSKKYDWRPLIQWGSERVHKLLV